MSKTQRKLHRKLYGLLILLLGLQGAAISLMIYFAGDRLERDKALLGRTETMLKEVFPGIRKDLSDVSLKTSEIKEDLTAVKGQVSRVENHVVEVGIGVSEVGSRVQGLDRNVTGFIEDTSGLIWGHSLNPFLLLGSLIALAVAIPSCGWFFSKKERNVTAPSAALRDSRSENFSTRLDKLTLLVEKIRNEEVKSKEISPELWRLMHETERLINEARTDLAQISGNSQLYDGRSEVPPDKLH